MSRRPPSAAAALVVAAACALAPASAAAARPKPVTGTLAKSGYTVVALAADGKAKRTVARPRIRLVPPAKRFTLHLIGADGDYLGPIVAKAGGRTAVMGFRAGAKLGRVRVKRGFAQPAKPLSRRWIDKSFSARARRGVPVGARKAGLVKGRTAGRAGRGLDPDHDGLPGTFDVDDDGDLVFDNVDPSSARASVHAGGGAFHASWRMSLGLGLTFVAERDGISSGVAGFALNRNARNTAADDGTFEKNMRLAMRLRGILLFPIPTTGTELDCRLILYCSKLDLSFPGSGTARDITDRKAFPGEFDEDGDGAGTMTPAGTFFAARDGIGTVQGVDAATTFAMRPKADPENIHGGQTFFERVPGESAERVIYLNYVFGTVPALAAWSDGQGGGGPVTYPVPAGGAGTGENPAYVTQSPDGDYRLTFTLWRPQRKGETAAGEATWMDVGRLAYNVAGRMSGPSEVLWQCPSSALSSSTPGATTDASGVHDPAADRAADRANTLTVTANISQCMRASGLPGWPADPRSAEINVSASSEWGDQADGVGFYFRPVASTSGPPPPPPPPGPPAAFSGTWRFAGGSPSSNIDWVVQANEFPTSTFAILVYDPHAITSIVAQPAGWTCTVQQISRPDDSARCNADPGTDPLQPGGPTLGGQIALSSPGTNEMAVHMAAPASSSGPAETGYPLTKVP